MLAKCDALKQGLIFFFNWLLGHKTGPEKHLWWKKMLIFTELSSSAPRQSTGNVSQKQE